MDRIIGLDLGSKTCGVSICDVLHITCRALTTVRFESNDYDACLEEVLKLLKENKVKWYQTTNNIKWLQFNHCLIGKPQRIIIYKVDKKKLANVRRSVI